MNIADAEHEESAPEAANLFISKLVCSLAGETHLIEVMSDTLAHRAYNTDSVSFAEPFYCNYGLNPAFQDAVNDGKLKVTGVGANGEARIVELSGHRFYLATLFVPQISSTVEKPHPLITSYLKAALAFRLRDK